MKGLDKLRPCPYCGGSELTILSSSDIRNGRMHRFYIVRCDECMAKGPEAEATPIAVKLWNVRTEDARKR